MWQSLFLSSISALALAAAGCGDDGGSCGAGSAPAVGLVAGNNTLTLTYGHLSASLNNDCPAADAPAGIVSMTITGTQTDGTGLITLCVERPDLFATTSQSLGPDVGSAQVHVFDVEGSATDCTYKANHTLPPAGSATATGLCSNGASSSGFALGVSGALSLDATCSAGNSTVAVQLVGSVAVTTTGN